MLFSSYWGKYLVKITALSRVCLRTNACMSQCGPGSKARCLFDYGYLKKDIPLRLYWTANKVRGCVHSTYAGGMGGWVPRGRTLSYGMGGWVQTLRMYKEKTGGFSLFEFCGLLQFEHHHQLWFWTLFLSNYRKEKTKNQLAVKNTLRHFDYVAMYMKNHPKLPCKKHKLFLWKSKDGWVSQLRTYDKDGSRLGVWKAYRGDGWVKKGQNLAYVLCTQPHSGSQRCHELGLLPPHTPC